MSSKYSVSSKRVSEKQDTSTVSSADGYVSSSYTFDSTIAPDIDKALKELQEASAYSAKSKISLQVVPATATSVYRKLLAGEVSRSVDQGGYWLHFELDSNGIPVQPRFILVTSDMSEWYYTEDKQVRVIDRLPKTGLFIFLYG